MEISRYVGNKIKNLRESKDMTQDQLAEMLDTTRQSISRYEIGERKVNQDILFELAEIFKVSINEFFPPIKNESIESIYNQLDQPRKAKVYNFAEYQLEEQKAQSVNVYGQTAAGEALEYDQSAIEEEIVSYVPKGTDGALIVRGDSMEPVLKNNELLFFRKTPQVENGDIAVVEIEGSAVTTKKVKYDFENEKIILQSINKKYDDMVFDNEDIRIIGKVLL